MVLRSQPRTAMKSKATVRLDFAKNNMALAAVVVWQSMVTALQPVWCASAQCENGYLIYKNGLTDIRFAQQCTA